MNEVYYCGKCRQQQQPSSGEKCKSCGKQTVFWYTSREKEEDALRKWKQIHGIR